jgi:RHH-type proline utilization regulon transcriptional repressor/proline dehydrogenase/delta 1-pyrroline-5-carboxylate dehydrogenase
MAADVATLLAPPWSCLGFNLKRRPAQVMTILNRSPSTSTSLAPFSNEPVLELRRATVRAQLNDALAALDRELPLSVPVMVGQESRAGSGEEFDSTDPGDPERVVARATEAQEKEVAAAVATAREAFRSWSRRSARDRALALMRAAGWMREHRLELAALEVRECAKPWPEADADVCEAIDFLEYYARGAVALEAGRDLIQVPGERNELRYAARGVAAVISPWNFPLAIPCGMTAAALATGNAVVLKPAEQSPGCALRLVEALRAGGVPAEAISLLPGAAEVGAALTRDPGVHTIAFTGSMQVGLQIARAAAEPHPGQHHLKRVVAELGGKNCVLVDADADLDEAVPEIASSAFVYAGQKCSAAARVLVHEAIVEPLLGRLAGAVRVLVVGQAADLQTVVPPVIERAAKERVDRYRELAAASGRVVALAEPVPEVGWFCPPAIVTDLPTDSPVLAEEVFGPLLAVEPIADIEQGCEIVERLPYALTGGLFARDPATVRYVWARNPVGNLYVNRGITGAKVGRQPFGGNKLSGTGSKAGGPDYLLQFVEPRVMTENTMRHGLVVH